MLLWIWFLPFCLFLFWNVNFILRQQWRALSSLNCFDDFSVVFSQTCFYYVFFSLLASSIFLKFQMHDIHQHIHTHISHKLIIQRPCITQHIDLILLNGFVCPPFLSLSEFKEFSFYHCYLFSMAQNKPNWPFQITTFHNRITSNKSQSLGQSHLEIKRCDRNWRQNIQTMYDLKMKIMSFFPKKFMIPSRFQHLFVFSLFIFILENFENVNWIVGFNLAFDSFIRTSIYEPRDIRPKWIKHIWIRNKDLSKPI